jgi:hypothetical protein
MEKRYTVSSVVPVVVLAAAAKAGVNDPSLLAGLKLSLPPRAEEHIDAADYFALRRASKTTLFPYELHRYFSLKTTKCSVFWLLAVKHWVKPTRKPRPTALCTA